MPAATSRRRWGSGVACRACTVLVGALLAGGLLAGCGGAAAGPSQSTTAPGGVTSSAPQGGVSPGRAAPPAALAIHRFASHPLAFRYPSDWQVAAEVRPIGPGTEQRETATISDASGRVLLTVYVNWTPQDVGAEVTRAVLDSEPVPGLGSAAVRPGYYGFYVETAGDSVSYFMTLAPGRPLDGPGQRHGGPLDSMVQIASGYAVGADASPEIMQFQNAAAATAWLGSETGQKLRAVLLSLTVY